MPLHVTSSEAVICDDFRSETSSPDSGTSRKWKRPRRADTGNNAGAREGATFPLRSRPATASLARESFGVAPAVPEGMIGWRDPTSGRQFHFDQRTGHSIPIRPNSARPSSRKASGMERSASIRRTTIVDRSHLRKGLTLATESQGADKDEFDDPGLDAALASIPSPSPAGSVSTPRRSRFFDSRRPESNVQPRNLFVEEAIEPASRIKSSHLELAITRSLLQKATVLNQVDGKFILCTTAPAFRADPVLFCIDQHAADERYQLERILEDYITDCTTNNAAHRLDVTLTLGITRKQYETIRVDSKVKERMQRLGWSIEGIVMVHEALGHAQVDLKGIPYIIKERVLTDRERLKHEKLLSNTFANCLEEVASTRSPHPFGTATTDWLSLSRSIPSSLMDLMKNKACRSAIMFNDPLTKEAAERVVRRLGGCKFPFMCAHGRPTLVPLCEVKAVAKAFDGDDV
nr:TPA_inf: MLH3 [Pseudozyma tsukubaensis]